MDSLPPSVVAAAWPSCAVLRGASVSKGVRDILCKHPLRVRIALPHSCARADVATAVREAMRRFEARRWTVEIESVSFGHFPGMSLGRQYTRELMCALGPPVVAFSLAWQMWEVDRVTLFDLLTGAAGLTRLSLWNVELGKGLGTTAAFEHLTELRITRPRYTAAALANFLDALAAAPRLEVFEFTLLHGHACPTWLPENCFARLSCLPAVSASLRRLDTSAVSVPSFEIKHAYAHCTRLTELRISLREHEVPANDVAVLATLSSLRSLTLHGGAGLPPEAYAALGALPALDSLTLCNGANTVPLVPAAIGTAMAGLTRLTALNMTHRLSASRLRAWSFDFLGAVANPRLALRLRTPYDDDCITDRLGLFRAAVAEGRLRAVHIADGCVCMRGL